MWIAIAVRTLPNSQFRNTGPSFTDEDREQAVRSALAWVRDSANDWQVLVGSLEYEAAPVKPAVEFELKRLDGKLDVVPFIG